MEQNTAEREISDKAKELIEDYGEDFFFELIDVYLEDAPTRVAQMHAAFDSDDMEAFIRETHTLKSSSANLGALGLSARARALEFAGRHGKLDDIGEEVRQFEEEFAKVKAALAGGVAKVVREIHR
jgi:HPt (histidine-containing phosphotransfer) domain-containing protein